MLLSVFSAAVGFLSPPCPQKRARRLAIQRAEASAAILLSLIKRDLTKPNGPRQFILQTGSQTPHVPAGAIVYKEDEIGTLKSQARMLIDLGLIEDITPGYYLWTKMYAVHEEFSDTL